MFDKQISQLLLKDTFNLFNFSDIKTYEGVLQLIKEKFNKSSYDSLPFHESLRMMNYANKIFEHAAEEVEVDQNDEVMKTYVESINSFVENIEDSDVKSLVGYITK